MKKLQPTHGLQPLLLVMALSGLVMTVGCDNQMNFSPTVPAITDISTNVGALRTLSISGSLAAEQGSIAKATILFDGVEIQGARSRCENAQGCAELELAGIISSPAGHHTITFKVLRQSAEVELYSAAGRVEISRAGLQLPEQAVLDLQPIQASLQAGEGVTFQLDLRD